MDSLESLRYSALGSRSKRLSDSCFEQVKQVYEALSIAFDPTFYPYVAHIARTSGDTIADLAKGLGISHPAASKMVKRLHEAKLISLKSDKTDKRTKRLFLTAKGEAEFRSIQPVLTSINAVMERMDGKSDGLLAALEAFEQGFAETPLRHRVLKHLVEEQLPLSCRPYEKSFHAFYETHNRIWIQKNFTL
ncbi:MAG: MarR family transcriptional regulator, partial [Alphaproteobacteria bacterium]|nr:MarR family transcriptional regulator [Alphaproteobacteria bacterium]